MVLASFLAIITSILMNYFLEMIKETECVCVCVCACLINSLKPKVYDCVYNYTDISLTLLM